MKLNRTLGRAAALATVLASFCGIASAGRPLTVDDANVNEVGAGQLEVWTARSQGSTTYNLAPAYAPMEGLEIGALLAREPAGGGTTTALQAKWLFTPSQENGCNFGAVLGVSHTQSAGNTNYLNGLLTCNSAHWGSVHLNLGMSKPKSLSASTGWGVAYEKEVFGVTPHVEVFGGEGTKPTVQAGLRGNIAKGVQLDGSVGRGNGVTTYTVGMKFQF